MSSRIVYISRLLGVFMLIFTAGEITHRATIVDTATALIEAPAVLWITGMMTVAAGWRWSWPIMCGEAVCCRWL